MDRGIKIAILCACLLSLGLGIIWDSVIDVVRPTPQSKENKYDMGPDRISATIGDASLVADRPAVLAQPETSAPESGDSDQEPIVETHQATPSVAADGEWPKHVAGFLKDGKYVVQPNDSYWKIAYKPDRFKFLHESKKIASSDWEAANPSVSNAALRPGMLLTIPTK